MRLVVLALLAIFVVVPASSRTQAQVINGESTDDAAYAPRPPARWTPPAGRSQPSEIDPQDDDDRQPDYSQRPRE